MSILTANIEKWKWADDTELTEVNWFSSIAKTLIETLDLTPYILEGGFGKIKKTFSSVETNGNVNRLVFTSSNITLKLNGIANNEYLKSFFLITEDSTYYKYYIKIFADNNLIWSGFVNQDSVEREFSNEDSDTDIDCNCFSYENEFKSYFSTKNITENPGFQKETHIPEQHKPGTPNPDIIWYYIYFTDLCHSFFSNVFFEFESGIELWRVSDVAYIGVTKDLNNTVDIFIKQGYHRLWDSGIPNMYDVFKKICNSMGWIFYFDKEIMYVRNAASKILSLNTLDFNKFEKGKLSQSKANILFNSVVIPDGVIYGGDGSGIGSDFRGSFWIILSNTYDYPMTNKQWSKSIAGRLDLTTPYKWFRIEGVEWNNDYFKTIMFEWPIGRGAGENYPYFPNTLQVDTGDTNTYYMGYSINGGYHFLTEEQMTLQNDEFRFKGNYGGMLYKIVDNHLYTYVDYITTIQFKNNFNKFLSQNRNRKISGNYLDELFDHLVYYNIINGTEFNLNNFNWALNSIENDLENGNTNLDLQIMEAE